VCLRRKQKKRACRARYMHDSHLAVKSQCVFVCVCVCVYVLNGLRVAVETFFTAR
jgi:hypothetical protein